MTKRFGICCALSAALLFPAAAEAQFSEQAELTGNPGAETGYSVAISADGSTAILGAPADNDWVGSATVFVRDPGNGGAWVKQATLAAPDAIGGANQGNGVALSADGNTAIVGGPVDNHFTGAAWVWTRSGQNWSEQAKLVGTSDTFYWREQGSSVALSADGNTALIGAPQDDDNIGAGFVFVRSVGQWSQQTKLVGTGVIAPWADQGLSVSLSADGNTAILGGAYDAQNAQSIPIGAAWVFRRTAGQWQQDVKLTASDPNLTYFGTSVGVSGRGTVVIVGGLGSAGHTVGGAWVFTRSPDGVWDQVAKLVGVDRRNYPYPAEGYSVSLSSNGHRALVGGWFGADNNTIAPGAGYLFSDASGRWRQASHALIGSDSAPYQQGWSGALSANGRTVLLGGPGGDGGAAWVFGPAAPALADAAAAAEAPQFSNRIGDVVMVTAPPE